MGAAVACGLDDHGQCNLPALEEGLTYTQAAAGGDHTVLLRSDGAAVACGDNDDGECDLPALEEGLTYTQAACSLEKVVLQASFDGTWVRFATLSGEERCRIKAKPTDRLREIHLQVTAEIGSMPSKVDVILPEGEVLRNILRNEPNATLSSYVGRGEE